MTALIKRAGRGAAWFWGGCLYTGTLVGLGKATPAFLALIVAVVTRHL